MSWLREYERREECRRAKVMAEGSADDDKKEVGDADKHGSSDDEPDWVVEHARAQTLAKRRREVELEIESEAAAEREREERGRRVKGWNDAAARIRQNYGGVDDADAAFLVDAYEEVDDNVVASDDTKTRLERLRRE